MAPRKLRTNVLELFHEKIEYMEWLPGEVLHEARLCEEFSVSRTPIREALIILQGEKLVNIYPQSGTFVSKIDMEYIKQLTYFRHVMEKEILLEMIDKNISVAKETEKVLAMQEINLRLHDVKSFMKNDDDFHEQLFQLAGHHELWEIIEKSSRQRNRFRWLKAELIGLTPTITQHQEIVDCIEKKDKERLLKCLFVHHDINLEEAETLRKMYPKYFTEKQE